MDSEKKWTAEITEKLITDGKLRVTIIYTNGETAFTEFVFLPAAPDEYYLNKKIYDRIHELETLEAYKERIPVGSVDQLPELVAIPPIPNPKREEFLTLLATYRQLRKAVDLEIMLPNNTEIESVKKKLRDLFIPGFLELL